MLIGKPDIVMREVEAPDDHRCDSGHSVFGTFKRGGPASPPEPIKFFQVSTKEAGVIGTYCEPCLVIANHIKRLSKRNKAESLGGEHGGTDPVQSEDR